MKRFKILFTFLITILSLFVFVSPAFAAESPMENKIKSEITSYVSSGELPSWHLKYIDDEGYQTYYWKRCHLSDYFDDFKSATESFISFIISMYKNETTDTWDYILSNLDIDPSWLEPNKYLGLYWDSFYRDYNDEGYLYLIWTSHYTPSEFVTITQFKESGRVYNLYDSEQAMDDMDANWLASTYYHFKEYDLTLHITPIGGFTDNQNFGIGLKRTYNFQGFVYGMDQGQYYTDMDPTNQFNGICKDEITFDLGLVPKMDGKNSMQLVTHGYEIIEACEAQSHFDLLAYGGYGHFAYFNTTIEIDKIYRVDVAYKITNDDKPWYEFFLPDEEHQITKSLTPERVKGGIFGLYDFAGFEEGSYQSTIDGRTNYKYKLHLNYDDTAWNWFVGQEFYECDYRRVSNFQILRMNFLVDGETYDVPIKMDTIEGDTLFILDPDLILDTETPYYDFKNWLDDGIADLKEKFKDYLPYIYAVAGIVGGVLLIWVGIKVYKFFRFLFGWIPDKKDDNQNKKE